MKILYCLNCIQNIGGIEKVTLTKANALLSSGIEVGIAVTDHNPKIPSYLTNKIKLYDLEINYYKDDWKSFFHRLKGFVIKRNLHRKRLRDLLNKINPDIVISVGQCEKYFLPGIKGNWKTIREFHYDKKYRLRGAKNKFQILLAHCINFYDYNFVINRYDKIVVLTKEDKENNWKRNKKIITIPNPITVLPSNISSLNNYKVVAVGRLVDQKNFLSLIRAFKIALDKLPKLILEIWGNGPLLSELKNYINNNNLERNIYLKGENKKNSNLYINADCLVMSSKYEGWGLVLTEAMAHGLPVISYNCPCGPKDIIIDGYNGFLVPINNEQVLSDKIVELMENFELRKKMGNNAKQKSEDYLIDKIMKEWIMLFNDIQS